MTDPPSLETPAERQPREVREEPRQSPEPWAQESEQGVSSIELAQPATLEFLLCSRLLRIPTHGVLAYVPPSPPPVPPTETGAGNDELLANGNQKHQALEQLQAYGQHLGMMQQASGQQIRNSREQYLRIHYEIDRVKNAINHVR